MEFRAYQEERERLRRELAPALESFRRGEGEELNVAEHVARRLAEKGIADE